MRTTTMDLAFLTLLAAGLVYFSIDAWFGASGGMFAVPMETEIRQLERQISVLESEKAALEAKNEALSGPVVDAELLEERLRAVYGVADPRDALIQDLN